MFEQCIELVKILISASQANKDENFCFDDLCNAVVLKLCSHGTPVFHPLCVLVLPLKLNSGYSPIHRKILTNTILSILCFWLINLWYRIPMSASNFQQLTKWIHGKISILTKTFRQWIIFGSALSDYRCMLTVVVLLLHIII